MQGNMEVGPLRTVSPGGFVNVVCGVESCGYDCGLSGLSAYVAVEM